MKATIKVTPDNTTDRSIILPQLEQLEITFEGEPKEIMYYFKEVYDRFSRPPVIVHNSSSSENAPTRFYKTGFQEQ